MNEEKQQQAVSSTIHTETQTLQLQPQRQLTLEATEIVHSGKEAVTQHNYAESSQDMNTYYQNELEIEPEEPAIVNIHITSKKYRIIYADSICIFSTLARYNLLHL